MLKASEDSKDTKKPRPKTKTKKSQLSPKDPEKSTALTSVLGHSLNQNEENEESSRTEVKDLPELPSNAETETPETPETPETAKGMQPAGTEPALSEQLPTGPTGVTPDLKGPAAADSIAPDPSDLPPTFLSQTQKFPGKFQKLRSAFHQEEQKYHRATATATARSKTMTDTDTEELADLAPDVDSYESAALLLIKGGTDRFRSLAFFQWEALQVAFCFMFQCGVKLTLRRISEFLIFLLPEARSRSEEDVQQGERLTQMHGKVQQTAVVLVESLREADQEMLWFSQEGLTILMQLQLGDARLFFARPLLQRIMCDLWRGVRPDSYARSSWKQLQVWARLLLYSGPNIAILIFWAVVPALEEWMQELSILVADKGRQEEAAYWEGKRKNGKSHSTGAFGWE